MADQAGEGLFSPYLKRQRIKAARPFLNGKVLDFGCGTGSLTFFVDKKKYLGIEHDETSLEIAKSRYPDYRFTSGLNDPDEKFDTIVALAVIEHVKSPENFLNMLAKHLKSSANSSIVCTTPHPRGDWIHDFGASVGLFSKHANEEHEELLDKDRLFEVGHSAGLSLHLYKKFLFGVNQLAIFRKAPKRR